VAVLGASPIARPVGRADGSRRVFLVLLGVLPPLVLAVLVLPTPIALATALPAWLILPWVWRRPIRGLYIIFGAALLLEEFPLHFSDSLTDRSAFFENFNNSSAALSGVTINPAEIVMLAAILIWLASSISRRSLELPRGPLVKAYVVFGLVLVGAEVQGMAAGGSYLISLWELRPQAYALIAFLLASTLVRTRGDLLRLTLIFFAVVALKGLIADYRYLVTLHRDLYGIQQIMAHEESYFFGLFLIAALGTFLWCRRRRVLLAVAALVPVVGVALMANQRRAGILALAFGLGLFVVVAARFDAVNRRRLVAGSVISLIVLGAFLVTFWDHQSGLIGELVRPFHSFYQPDSRDTLSNLYRQAEDANLLLTIKSSPLIGIGFGRPMLYAFKMADISNIYPLWNYIPHNTLLWIGMRMGVIGFVAFFGLLGMAILRACRVAADTRDALVRGVAIFAVAAIGMELTVGYLDLQLDNYRNLIFLGVLLGVVNSLPAVAARLSVPPEAVRERGRLISQTPGRLTSSTIRSRRLTRESEA
jgi:O-antigen ligase